MQGVKSKHLKNTAMKVTQNDQTFRDYAHINRSQFLTRFHHQLLTTAGSIVSHHHVSQQLTKNMGIFTRILGAVNCIMLIYLS